MIRRLAISLSLLAACALAPRPARADATEDARVLFNAGAVAYKAGDFRTALQAFEQAYKIEARPGVLFSIAQAQRRQYALDQKPARAADALRRYREYLARVDQGGRRADAVAALAELEPIVQRLEREGQLKGAELDDERQTRLVVSCPVEGAVLYLDHVDKPRPVSLVVALPPGKHALRVHADGYADERRELEIAAGSVTALDMPLRELPAQLAIGGPRGAEVTVDGRPVGAPPFASTVEVAPGRHLVRFTLPGHLDAEEEIVVPRGETRVVTATLPRTTQRTAAWAFIGVGAGTAVVGAIVGVAAALQQNSANNLKSSIDTGTLYCPGSGCATLASYNSALDSRDTLRAVGGTLAGIGVVAAGTGVLLYYFDEPLRRRSTRDNDGVTPVAPKAAPVPFDVSASLGPGLYGASVRARF